MVFRPLLVLLAGLVLAACSDEPTHAPLTLYISAQDKSSELRVPDSWAERSTLHPLAELQVGSETDNSYVVVVSEARSSLPGMDLDQFSKLTREGLMAALQDGSVVGGPTTVEIDARPGIRYKMTGELDGQTVAYVHTVLGGNKRYYQLLAWTNRAAVAEHGALLDAVVDSFRAVER